MGFKGLIKTMGLASVLGFSLQIWDLKKRKIDEIDVYGQVLASKYGI